MDHATPAEDGVADDEKAAEIEHRFETLGELLRTARSVSAAVQWWTGEGPPEINVIGARERVLTVPEYKVLTGRHHSRGYERLGLLRTGGSRQQVVAWTRALVIPDRLPASMRMRLGIPHPDNPVAALPTRQPIGVVLAELGERAVRTNTAVTPILGRQDAIGSELALPVHRRVGGRRVTGGPSARGNPVRPGGGFRPAGPGGAAPAARRSSGRERTGRPGQGVRPAGRAALLQLSSRPALSPTGQGPTCPW